MAKNDQKEIHDTAMGKVGQAETEYKDPYNQAMNRSDVTWDRGTEDYNKAYSGYSDYAAGGGLKQEDIDRMRNAWGQVGSGSGGGGGGGFAASQLGTSAYKNLSSAFANAYRPDYGESDTGFRTLADKGGGFDTQQLQQIYGNIGTLTDIGKTGGITEEDRNNILRKQMLEQEQTGGYSDQDKALVRAKSAASSPAYFAALKDNLQRQRGQTGNLANAGAVDFKLARQGSQQQAQDRLAQEMALQESVRGGKERAAAALSQKGLDLAGLRTANQLTGARSAAETGTGTQAAITANQQRALQGLQESQTGLGNWGLGQAGGLDQFSLNRAGGLDQWDITQAQLNQQAAAARAASGAASDYASSRDRAEYEQWLTEYGNTQKQYGIGGLESLYNTNLGASQNYSQLGLNALNSKYGAEGTMLGIAAANRGKTASENMGMIGGIAAPMIGNLVGLGKGSAKPTANNSSNPTNSPNSPSPGYSGSGAPSRGNIGGGNYDPRVPPEERNGRYDDQGRWIPF